MLLIPNFLLPTLQEKGSGRIEEEEGASKVLTALWWGKASSGTRDLIHGAGKEEEEEEEDEDRRDERAAGAAARASFENTAVVEEGWRNKNVWFLTRWRRRRRRRRRWRWRWRRKWRRRKWRSRAIANVHIIIIIIIISRMFQEEGGKKVSRMF